MFFNQNDNQSPFSAMKKQINSQLQTWDVIVDDFHNTLVDANLNALDGKFLVSINVFAQGVPIPNIALRETYYSTDFLLAICSTERASEYKIVNIYPEVGRLCYQEETVKRNQLIETMMTMLTPWVNNRWLPTKKEDYATPEEVFAIVDNEVINLCTIKLINLLPSEMNRTWMTWSNINSRNKIEIYRKILEGQAFYSKEEMFKSIYILKPSSLLVYTPKGSKDIIRAKTPRVDLPVKIIMKDKIVGEIIINDYFNYGKLIQLQRLNYLFDF